jgi:hypothetical protein
MKGRFAFDEGGELGCFEFKSLLDVFHLLVFEVLEETVSIRLVSW